MRHPNPSLQTRCQRRARLGVFTLLCLASPLLLAEVRLADAVASAYQKHPDSRLAEARRDVGRAQEWRASQPLADAAAFNLKYQTDTVGSGNGFREWESGVEMPLWWPGQASAQQQEADSTLASADALTRAKQLDVASEVRERLWAWALARSSHQEAQLAYSSAKQLAADIARRAEAGELPHTDLLLAKQELAAREDELRQAAAEAQRAASNFKRYTGLAESPAMQAEQQVAAEDGLQQHPALVLASLDVERARAQRDRLAAAGQANPSLWVGGKSSRDVSGADYDSAIGLEVTIPFGGTAHAAPTLAEAEAALTEVIVNYDSLRRELEENLANAQLTLRQAQASVRQAQQQRTLVDESLRLSRRAFDLGEIDLVRLLRARADARAARQTLETRRLYVAQALARLNQALGVIPR